MGGYFLVTRMARMTIVNQTVISFNRIDLTNDSYAL